MRLQREHKENENAVVRAGGPVRGSVLIIVLWIAFGLVSITLYFADSMGFEYRAADNRLAGIEAEQAIEGAARYVSYVLSDLEQPGVLPDPLTYRNEAVPVGSAAFWLIGRGDKSMSPEVHTHGLIDEASKLNLNAPWVTSDVLSLLPRVTPEIAASIISWRSTSTNTPAGGAESETYMRLQPPYMCKSGDFETIDELRLIYGMDLDILYGEDVNLNGVLDPAEDDGDAQAPVDNRDGRLEPGILEYVTVYSKEPAVRSNGDPRINITQSSSQTALAALLRDLNFDQGKIDSISALAGQVRSPLELCHKSKMTASEFAQIEAEIRGENLLGLLNVNTAGLEVLSCIPGLDSEKAATLAAFREALDNPASLAWVAEALKDDAAAIEQAGPYLTGRSYQVSADIAAVGRHRRGARRARFVFDIGAGSARILYRQDLSHLGWALGKQARDREVARRVQ